jgi:polyisoprenoid-binding protein YceI
MLKAALAVLASLAVADSAHAGGRAFVVDSAASQLTISVGKAGLFGFAGHEHEVLATVVEGTIVAEGAAVARSSVTLRFAAAGLKVSGRGEPPEDVPKVQEKMTGLEVLDAVRFPVIEFRSTAVEGREGPDETWNLRVTGELAIHGVTQRLTLPVRVRIDGDSLVATGQAVIRQGDFGIRPVSVGGVVKVKNELGVDYKFVGKAAP